MLKPRRPTPMEPSPAAPASSSLTRMAHAIEHAWRQCSRGNAQNASTSNFAESISAAAFGNRSASIVATSSQRAVTSSGVVSVKIDRNAAATISWCALGTGASRLRT